MSSKNLFKYDRLTPDNAAFLFVDHQTGLLPLVNDWSEIELKNNVLVLTKLAKIYKMPVVLTTSYKEGPNGPIAPSLKEMFPDVNIIKRLE